MHGKLNLNTFPHRAALPAILGNRAILDARRQKSAPQPVRPHRGRSLFLALILLFFLLIPLPNPAHSGTARIPFRTVQSLIVVEGKVNGNAATFLLDTGANRTIVSAKIYASARFDLQRMPRRGGAGFSGYSLRRSADVELAENIWTAQQVSVMDLDELKQMLHMDFDALLGQDFLRQFRSVRIDYRAHIIEFQE
jgi:gag-polyprotein putative aspartyl protease